MNYIVYKENDNLVRKEFDNVYDYLVFEKELTKNNLAIVEAFVNSSEHRDFCANLFHCMKVDTFRDKTTYLNFIKQFNSIYEYSR